MSWRDEPDLAVLFRSMPDDASTPLRPDAEELPECVRCHRPVSGDRCPRCRAIQSTYKETTK